MENFHSFYESYYTKRHKEFVQLLQYILDDVGFMEVGQAIKELERIHPDHVTTDRIKVLCTKNRHKEPVVRAVLSETGQEIAARAAEHLRMYDDLFYTHTAVTKEDAA
jgi:hypothetical protein